MSCEAVTYADGSWFCQKCGIGGDKDEPVEEFCKLTRSNAPAPRPYMGQTMAECDCPRQDACEAAGRCIAGATQAEQAAIAEVEFYGGTVTGRFYGTAHSHPAER